MARLKRTTIGKVFLSLYIVGIGGSGLVALVIDILDIVLSSPSTHRFENLRVWLGLSIEGGLILSPVILVFAAILAFINNLFASDEDTDG